MKAQAHLSWYGGHCRLSDTLYALHKHKPPLRKAPLLVRSAGLPCAALLAAPPFGPYGPVGLRGPNKALLHIAIAFRPGPVAAS